jgi:polar amino acid transport system substrate-binding protein/arginine/ornithine transport system substrate-binding protein
MMMKTLAFFAIAAFLPPFTARADKLTFGNEGFYPPFSMVDASGKLTGFEPDLAREMCSAWMPSAT